MTLLQERGGSGTPTGKWLLRPCHKSCRACQGGSPPRRPKGFLMQKRQELRQNDACGHHEKTCHVALRRHDTLCVRGVFLFCFSNNNLQHLATAILAGKRR
jgi:hypothetical protein